MYRCVFEFVAVCHTDFQVLWASSDVSEFTELTVSYCV